MNNYSIKKPLVKGSNNGTIGFGMGRGSLFPPSMNGPFGFINHPLPLRYDFPTNLQLNNDCAKWFLPIKSEIDLLISKDTLNSKEN